MINSLKKFFYIFFIFFFIRLILIYFYPADHELKYIDVAENILNGCGISFSLPDSNDCIPAYGPNGPGYPYFLAILKSVFDNDNFIKVTQICIYLFSILFLKKQITKTTGSKITGDFTFIILSVSPLTLSWSRFILPEIIMISLSLIFIGYLIKSLTKKKFYNIEFCLLFVTMTFVRADAIFFIVPILYLIFKLYIFKEALKKILVFSIIFAIPWCIWTYRNFHSGASIFPNIHESYETRTKEKFPSGYSQWILTWAFQQYDFAYALNPTHLNQLDKNKNFNYEDIKIKEDIYFNDEEKYETIKLFNELKLNSGKPFPEHIDKKFEVLAKARANENKMHNYVVLPIKRSINLWFNPYYSHGWPVELQTKLHDNKINLNNKSIFEKIKLIKIFPLEILMKAILFFWITMLVFLFALFSFKKKNENLKLFYLISFQLILLKTIFFAYTGFFETRYIVNLIPFLEVFIILAISKSLRKSN